MCAIDVSPSGRRCGAGRIGNAAEATASVHIDGSREHLARFQWDSRNASDDLRHCLILFRDSRNNIAHSVAEPSVLL
jgi:hypothetical protein